MVDVSSTGQSTTVRPNPNTEQGGATPVRHRREEEQNSNNNNPAANVGAQDRVDIRKTQPQSNEGNAVAKNEAPARQEKVAQATTTRKANAGRVDNPNQNPGVEKKPRAEKADQANQQNNTRKVKEENSVTRPTRQPANQPDKPEAVRAAQKARNEQIHGNQPGNAGNQNQGNRVEPNARVQQEEAPTGNKDIAKHNVPETKANVQETASEIRKRDDAVAAAKTPALSAPKQDIARINLSSSANKNPSTPGLEGSIAEKAEAAQVKHAEEQARFEQLREKAREEQGQRAQQVENRNPVSVQTRVGRNVDRLI